MAGEISKHWRLMRAYASLHLKTAMEYRWNFIIQSGMMLLNDALYVIIFVLLFGSFGDINGYTSQDALIIYGISAFSYGLLAVFFGQNRHLYTIIADGRMDTFLTQPADPLLHAYASSSRFDGWGDIAFGIIVLAVLRPAGLHIGILVGLLGAIVLLAFDILIDSIAFWMERPKHTTRSIGNALLGFSSWPVESFGGITKMLIYIIPVAFIASVPHKIVVSFSWGWLLTLTLTAIVMLLIAVAVFRIGLKRYESGNAVVMRG